MEYITFNGDSPKFLSCFEGRVPSPSQVAASPEAEAEVVRDSVDSHVEVNWFYMFVVGNGDPWPALAIGEMFRHLRL